MCIIQYVTAKLCKHSKQKWGVTAGQTSLTKIHPRCLFYLLQSCKWFSLASHKRPCLPELPFNLSPVLTSVLTQLTVFTQAHSLSVCFLLQWSSPAHVPSGDVLPEEVTYLGHPARNTSPGNKSSDEPQLEDLLLKRQFAV